MKQLFALFFSIFIFTEILVSQQNINTETLKSILHRKELRSTLVGAKVVNIASGTTIFEMNSNTLLHPASGMKLLTTAAAFFYLGKNFQVRTEIYHDEKGNVYLKGFGDAILRTEHYDMLAKNIVKQGITTVENIIVDGSYFDDMHWGKGWMWDDEPDASAMYISPVCINRNSVKVFITPNNVGEKPNVELEPSTSFFLLLNEAITVQKIDKHFPKFEVTRKWKERENTIIIKGQLLASTARDTFELNVWKPQLYAATIFKERLKTNGIQIRGEINVGDAKGKKIATSIHPLDSLVCKANKESDNLCAENLLKILAAEKNTIPAVADSGIELEKKFFASIGIDTSKIVIADGSGVSDYNLVSVNNMITILLHQFNQRQTFSTYKYSLPIAGKDGTLKNRMRGTSAEGKVFAKTGTKRGVSSLAGYVNDNIAFAVIINNYYGKTKTLRDIIDAFVVELSK
ncbi:MAG: D-alanyl-D-alanine carboxypeptidase/D-alanyl-D-alanine-endopeptidase [Ignavibacteria bacterium]|nr:D-alanyl-D-alanine carboxypeptidase/D-alanyl-D-alanine-endopeptidase [Ignavibacteria bacterium]